MHFPKNIIFDTNISDKLNFVGQKYNKLTCEQVVGYVVERNNSRRVFYLFACDCGGKCISNARDVSSGKVSSCKCNLKDSSKKLGKSNKKEPSENKALVRYFQQYQSSAKRRDLIFELSLDSFREITKKNCRYCGIAPSKYFGKNSRTFSASYVCNGIDRIDNTKGYTYDNCCACCKNCNIAKNNLPQEEFIAWIKRIVIHNLNIDNG